MRLPLRPVLLLLMMAACTFVRADDSASSAATTDAVVQDAVLDNLVARYRALDEQAETRIAAAVQGLARLEDTRSSGQQVIEMKRNAIRALEGSIDYYHERINQLTVDFRALELPGARATIAEQIDYFYARMEKRIADVVALTASLARHTGAQGYLEANQQARAQGQTTAQGGAERDLARNAELLKARADVLIEEVVARLTRDAAILKQRADDLAARMSGVEDETVRSLVSGHVDALTASIQTRIDQIRAAQTPDAPAGEEIGNREAQDTADTLQDISGMIRDDLKAMDALRQEINQALKEEWSSGAAGE
jgi:hypothetical protein